MATVMESMRIDPAHTERSAMSALTNFLAAVKGSESPTDEDLRAVAAGLEAMQRGASFAKAFGPKKRGRKPISTVTMDEIMGEMEANTPRAQQYFLEFIAAVRYTISGAQTVAEELGKDERTIYRYYRRHAKTVEQFAELVSIVCDIAEEEVADAYEALSDEIIELREEVEALRREVAALRRGVLERLRETLA